AAINGATGNGAVTWVNVIFSVCCFLGFFLYKLGKLFRTIGITVFFVLVVSMFTFFLCSGQPDGFGVIWIATLPSFSLLLLHRTKGSILSGAMFLILVFFFWTPWGKALVQYNYSETFRLHFPILYLAFYGIALLLETIRSASIRMLEKSRDRSEELYAHDPLTGIYNRYGFRKVRGAVFADKSDGHALAMLDLDLFKSINDRYGHDIGDDLLIEFAKIMVETAGDKAVPCRWGGEEFMLLFYRTEDAVPVCEKILNDMRKKVFRLDGNDVSATVSIGLVLGESGKEIEYAQALRQADRTLYQAKDQGRDRMICVPYAPSPEETKDEKETGGAAEAKEAE
ncbi:MAG: GGDEF domain-containing protein, partial [Clostridia bacterium]|nr:GGDEF domain-containing protein [Clostridia bacterium]